GGRGKVAWYARIRVSEGECDHARIVCNANADTRVVGAFGVAIVKHHLDRLEDAGRAAAGETYGDLGALWHVFDVIQIKQRNVLLGFHHEESPRAISQSESRRENELLRLATKAS